jgi:hypothetical protein
VVPEIPPIGIIVLVRQQSTVRVRMALRPAVIFIAGLGMTPVLSRIAVGVIWHEVEPLEFFENQAIAPGIAVIARLQAADSTSLSQERVTLLQCLVGIRSAHDTRILQSPVHCNRLSPCIVSHKLILDPPHSLSEGLSRRHRAPLH